VLKPTHSEGITTKQKKMAYAPRTQREILAALGDLPDPNANLSLLDRFRRFSREKHIQIILAMMLVFPVLFLLFDRSRKRSGSFYTTTVVTTPGDAGHSLLSSSSAHFWQAVPDAVVVLTKWKSLPSDNGDEKESSTTWEEIDRLDGYAQFVLVAARVPPEDLAVFNRHLMQKRANVGRASWFFAASSRFGALGALSPRITASPSFQTFLFGHQLEIMTASLSSSPSLQRRLDDTAKEGYPRIVVLTDVVDDVADLRLVTGYGPLFVLTRDGRHDGLLVNEISTGSSTTKRSLISEPMCAMRNFRYPRAQWSWNCGRCKRSIKAYISTLRGVNPEKRKGKVINGGLFCYLDVSFVAAFPIKHSNPRFVNE
jgi:hypothetical protein